MPKKIKECGKAHLISVPLPDHGDTYTVISHESVIDYAYTELAAAGFGIVSEEYRATADGNIAQGIYRLQYQNDPELSMMFAWTNSYNKQVRFKCGVGAYVNHTGTTMVCGDMGSWARKHTGTADEETIATIKEQIANAHMYYDQLVHDKNAMKEIKMNKRKQAQLLGILFAEYQILTTEQASTVRSQMDKPSHVFEDTSSLWAFYNYVTIALQSSHPKTWMEDQRVLHYFISSVNNFAKPVPVEVEVEHEEEERTIDPLLSNYGQPENQTNLLIQIAEAEAETAEVEEIEEIKVEQENKVCDEVVTYTDPMGNTFEAPVFDVIDLNKDTKMSVVVSPCAAHDAESEFMDGIDESIEPEVVSLEPTPEDHLVFETQQIETEDDFAFDFSDEDDDDSAFF
jgi:transcription antitermination factor NusG